MRRGRGAAAVAGGHPPAALERIPVRLAMGAPFAQHHGMREPSLRVQPVVGLLRELGDGVAGEELGSRRLRHAFVGRGLGAVLAVGVDRPLSVLVWPGAALTVELALLVDAQQRLRRCEFF